MPGKTWSTLGFVLYSSFKVINITHKYFKIFFVRGILAKKILLVSVGDNFSRQDLFSLWRLAQRYQHIVAFHCVYQVG